MNQRAMETRPPSPPAGEDDESELVKVSLNLPRSVLRKVKHLAAKNGLNQTTVIRRAIDLEAFMDEVTTNKGKILVKQGGDLKEVIFR